jgi:hypothetical protein
MQENGKASTVEHLSEFMRRLFKYSAAAFFLLLLFFLGLIALVILEKSNHGLINSNETIGYVRSLLASDGINLLSSVGQFGGSILGFGAAIAGAVVAIKLASQSVEISKRQAQIEDSRWQSEQAENVYRDFMVHSNSLVNSAKTLWERYLELTNNFATFISNVFVALPYDARVQTSLSIKDFKETASIRLEFARFCLQVEMFATQILQIGSSQDLANVKVTGFGLASSISPSLETPIKSDNSMGYFLNSNAQIFISSWRTFKNTLVKGWDEIDAAIEKLEPEERGGSVQDFKLSADAEASELALIRILREFRREREESPDAQDDKKTRAKVCRTVGTDLLFEEELLSFINAIEGSCPQIHPLRTEKLQLDPKSDADDAAALLDSREIKIMLPAENSVAVKLCDLLSLVVFTLKHRRFDLIAEFNDKLSEVLHSEGAGENSTQVQNKGAQQKIATDFAHRFARQMENVDEQYYGRKSDDFAIEISGFVKGAKQSVIEKLQDAANGDYGTNPSKRTVRFVMTSQKHLPVHNALLKVLVIPSKSRQALF